MSIIPIAVPDLPVLWHNAVVDVEPTSRYGLEHDLASVNSTLCYLNPSAEPMPVTLLAPSASETECNVRRQSREKAAHQEAVALDRERYRPAVDALAAGGFPVTPLEAILERSTKHYAAEVTLEPGRQVVRFHTRVPITGGADDLYQLRLAVPMGAGVLEQAALLSIVVLLPNDAPDCRIEVAEWSVELDAADRATVYGGDHPHLAGRAAVAWRWAGEPFVWLRYRYRR